MHTGIRRAEVFSVTCPPHGNKGHVTGTKNNVPAAADLTARGAQVAEFVHVRGLGFVAGTPRSPAALLALPPNTRAAFPTLPGEFSHVNAKHCSFRSLSM